MTDNVAQGDGAPVALVTGASGGIGGGAAIALAAAGFKLSLLARRTDGLAETPDQLICSCDVTSEASVRDAFDATRQQFGRIDHVIHAAGAVGRGPLAELSLEDWRATMDVNLTSSFLIAREAYMDLKAAQGGLVFLSSINGRNGGTVLSGPAYAASKAGVINLTRYLAKEWGGDGVRVNCVAPGPVATPMLDRLSDAELEALRQSAPLKRISTVEEVAGAIAFLCSDAAASTTGAVMNISAGIVLD